jgi:hypothetical protein
MKYLMIPALLAGSLIALSTMEGGRRRLRSWGGSRRLRRRWRAAVVTTAPVVTAPVVRPAGAVVAPRAPVVRRRCTGHDASGCSVNDTRQRPRLRSGEQG